MSRDTSPEGIFQSAVSFEHAGRVLAKHVGSRMPRFRGLGHMATLAPGAAPTIACLEFCVELYLKSLVSLETGTAPHGHDLEKLMQKVSSKVRKRIEHHYERFISKRPDRLQIEAAMPGTTKFRNALHTAGDGFVKWRYNYEYEMRKGMNMSPYLAFGVREAIFELKPDWEKFIRDLDIPRNVE